MTQKWCCSSALPGEARPQGVFGVTREAPVHSGISVESGQSSEDAPNVRMAHLPAGKAIHGVWGLILSSGSQSGVIW